MSKKPEQTKQTPELSADLFLTTALQLAEQSGGMQQLSLRNLGKALGVDATAVYRYFPSKAVLVDAMMQRLVQGLVPSDDEMAGDWRDQLRAIMWRAYHTFTTYPSLSIQIPSNPYVRTPLFDRLTELVYQALQDTGLRDEHVVMFHEILYMFALGMGQLDAQYEGILEDERTLMRDHAATLSSEEFPNIRRLAHLMVADTDAVFELVFEIYLKAIDFYSSGTTE